MAWVASAALGVQLEDINAQPKLFQRSFLEALPNPPWDFSLNLYALYMAKKAGLTLLEQPVCFARRHHGVSEGGVGRSGKLRLAQRSWRYIFQLRQESRGSTPSAGRDM